VLNPFRFVARTDVSTIDLSVQLVDIWNNSSLTCPIQEKLFVWFMIISYLHWIQWSRNSGVRRKFSWGGFHSVAQGGHLYLVCAVCDVTIW